MKLWNPLGLRLSVGQLIWQSPVSRGLNQTAGHETHAVTAGRRDISLQCVYRVHGRSREPASLWKESKGGKRIQDSGVHQWHTSFNVSFVRWVNTRNHTLKSDSPFQLWFNHYGKGRSKRVNGGNPRFNARSTEECRTTFDDLPLSFYFSISGYHSIIYNVLFLSTLGF